MVCKENVVSWFGNLSRWVQAPRLHFVASHRAAQRGLGPRATQRKTRHWEWVREGRTDGESASARGRRKVKIARGTLGENFRHRLPVPVRPSLTPRIASGGPALFRISRFAVRYMRCTRPVYAIERSSATTMAVSMNAGGGRGRGSIFAHTTRPVDGEMFYFDRSKRPAASINLWDC